MTDYLQLARQRAAGAPPADAANPYLDLARQDQQAQQDRARFVIEQALKDNPQIAAERQRLSQTSGLPLAVVERNFDELRRKEAAAAIDLVRMAQESPVLARQLGDPKFTTVAVDDVPVLQQMETAVGKAVRYVMGAAPGGGLAGDLEASLYRSAGAVAGTKRAAVDVIEPWARLVAGDDNWFAQMSKYYAGQAASAEDMVKRLSPPTDSTFGSGVSGGVQSFGQNAKYLPLALAGPGGGVLALAGMVGESFGASYNKAADKNLPLWQSLGYASADAMVEYWTEKLPMDKLIGGIQQGAPLIKTFAKQLGYEIPGEQLATVLQDLNEWATLNPDKPFKSYLAERPDAAVQTLIATVIGTGGNVMVTSSIANVLDTIGGPQWRNNLTQGYAELLQEQLRIAGQSALRERSPEQFRALVQQITESNEGAPKSVYVDGEVLNQLPAEVLTQLPAGVQTQIPEAAASGGVVEISMADVLTIAPGTELEQVLNQHARMDPFAQSPAEAQASAQQAQEFLQQEAQRVIEQAADQEALRQSQELVKTNIKQQLAATGRFRDAVNEGYATWAAAFYTAYGSRLGMTPEQFYQRYPLRVLGAPSAPGQQVMDQITPEQAMATNVPVEMPADPIFAEAVGNTDGAQITENGLLIDLVRFQKPEQEGAQAIRTGVFYLPTGAATAKHYKKKGTMASGNLYGGSEEFKGQTLIRRPLFVKGATGGKAPEAAYDMLKGKKAYEKMRTDVLNATTGWGVNEAQKIENVREMLKRYGADPSLAAEIVRNSRGGNLLPYAVQENIVAHAVREAGYDAVVGYSKGKAGSSISEVFDVREQTFPARGMDSQVHDVFNQSVSTRLPTAKKAAENPLEEMLIIGLDAAKMDRQAFEANMAIVRGYPNMLPAGRASADTLAERFIQHVVDNLLWLHDQVPADIRSRSKLWYDGARAIVDRWVPKYGLTDAQVSAVLAVLSPQKDWFMNVSLAERVLDAMTNGRDFRWDQAMTDKVNEVLIKSEEEQKALAAEEGAVYEPVDPSRYYEAVKRIQGKTLGEVLELGDDRDAAIWIRVYDQAFNTRNYRIVSPEGDFLDWKRNNPSKAQKKRGEQGDMGRVAWGSFGEIGKAVSVARDGSIANISNKLGGQHKVRNFYNNIFNPLSEHGDVTIDTHAVAAALLRPLAGGSDEVKHNFGSGGVSSSSVFGAKGTYGIYAEAYRRAAAERKILPREMQSITWEAVRGLFQAEQKKGLQQTVNAVWRSYRKGEVTLDEARAETLRLANGIVNPDWVGTARGAGPAWASSYSEELAGAELPVRGGADGRGAGGDARGTAGDAGVLEQGARGTFNPQTLELVLNPNADLSTWFHETGHFFLEVLADVASQPDAPAQIVDDYNKVLAWFGVTPEQWAGYSLDEKRPYHERWAESIEQYVMEGKAPSVELQGVMRRFRAWLTSVYGSIKRFLAQRGVAQPGGETLGQSGATNWEQVPAGERFTNLDEADEYLYHVTSNDNAEGVLNEGLAPNAGRMFGGSYRAYSRGKVFLTERNGVSFWQEKVEQQLFDQYDDPPDVVVLRIPKSAVGAELQADEVGTRDARAPAYFVEGETLAQGDQPAGSDIQLNDDIRRVMDRMLATDEQIAQANEVAGFMPDEQADGEAAERLQKRSIADLKWSVKARDKVIAKLKKQAREVEKAIREQVTAEVNQMPEVLAKEMLAKTRKENGRELNDVERAIIADAFGYESVDAMLKAIDAFGSKKDAIDGLTEQRMLEENGDLIDERAIQEAANEAVHNEARARSLATELRTQREMLGQRTDTGEVNARGAKITVNALVEAAKQFGANVIARTPLKDLKATAWKHTAAERRAGKRWAEATAKGETQEAVQAKQDQVLNNAAAKAAIDAATEAKKILEFFRRVTKGNDEKTVEKGRDPDIVNAARAVLASYGIETPTTKTAAAYLEAVKTNDPETYAAIEPMIAAATQNAQPLEALTFEELQGLAESIQAMWHLAKRSRQMEVDGDLMDIDEVADEVYARLETIGIPDRVAGEGMAVTQGEERTLFLQQGIAFLRRVEQWAEGMDGQYGGPFLRYIFQPIKDAADRYRAERITYRKKFQGLVDNLAPIVGDSVIQAPELGYTFGTPGSTAGTAMNEILHAIAHTGNDSNKRKLLLGRGWATENPDGTLDTSRWDAFIRRLVNEGKLERAHFDFVQGVWDLLEETKPLAQKAHRDAFGRYFSEVTANAFVDPFGVTRRGGYVPAQVDSRQVKDNALRKLAEEENNSMAYAFPQPAMGFTKSRTEYNKPLMLDLRTLSQHLDKVLLFSHMTVPARDVRKLLMRPKVSQPLNRVQPAAVESMLQPWLQRSAQQIVEDPIVGSGKWARIPGIVRSRAGMALMFANVSNAIQQVTGLAGAAVRVKPSYLMRSLAQYVSNPVKFSRTVWEASPYMDDRAKNEVAVMNEQMQAILIKPSTFEKVQDFSMRHAYFLQTALDNVLSPIVWTGAFNQGLADGMSEKDAIRFADSTVRQTQGSTLPEDVSRFETGPAYARAFTQFVGYFNMMANTNGTALKQIAGEVGLKKGAGKALYVVMLGFLAPIWIAEAIALAFKGGPEDEEGDGYLDDWLAAVFGMGTTKGLLAQIPILGQFGVAAANRFNDNPLDDRVSLSPAISLLESSVSAPESVYKAIVEDGSAQKAIRDVATLVSVATGVPLYGLARPVGYAAGVAQGKIEPTSPVDAARGLVTGTASPESKVR